MPSNIPCDMKKMSPTQKHEMVKVTEANHCLNPSDSNNENNNHDCNGPKACNDCNTTCVISFINTHKLIIDTYKQASAVHDESNFLLIKYQDSLYRPPLIS